MSFSSSRLCASIVLFSGLILSVGASQTAGQDAKEKDPTDSNPTRVRTADGLSLWAKWYIGGKSQNSDTVILVHGYGSDSTRWEPLAKSLRKQGYSVLLFDLRGHGRSTDFKVFDDKEEFVKQSFNAKLAGVGSRASLLKDLKREKFSPSYYPYLVNDLMAALCFVDQKHDIPECNSNRVFVITEKDSCPLVMLWLAYEFTRQGNGSSVGGLPPATKYVAGKDIAGVVFLSYGPSVGTGTKTALGIINQILEDKVYMAKTETVKDPIQNKISMLFMYGKEDKSAATEARRWFHLFGIPNDKLEDKEKVKYIYAIPGAEKLTGISLLDIGAAKKSETEKSSAVEKDIITFLEKTKEKGINGSDYLEKHYANNLFNELLPIENGRWAPK